MAKPITIKEAGEILWKKYGKDYLKGAELIREEERKEKNVARRWGHMDWRFFYGKDIS